MEIRSYFLMLGGFLLVVGCDGSNVSGVGGSEVSGGMDAGEGGSTGGNGSGGTGGLAGTGGFGGMPAAGTPSNMGGIGDQSGVAGQNEGGVMMGPQDGARDQALDPDGDGRVGSGALGTAQIQALRDANAEACNGPEGLGTQVLAHRASVDVVLVTGVWTTERIDTFSGGSPTARGFWVQAEQEGSGYFVRVDANTLDIPIAKGDVVSFVVTEVEQQCGAYFSAFQDGPDYLSFTEATSIENLVVHASGQDVSFLKRSMNSMVEQIMGNDQDVYDALPQQERSRRYAVTLHTLLHAALSYGLFSLEGATMEAGELNIGLFRNVHFILAAPTSLNETYRLSRDGCGYDIPAFTFYPIAANFLFVPSDPNPENEAIVHEGCPLRQ